jgi:2-C-methyl-D-erythritol 4-phosphate cytidylyltransferase
LPRDVGVILVAGGSGRRLGGRVAKQFQKIGGSPMLLRAMRPFTSHPEVHQVVIVLPPAVLVAPPEWLSSLMGGNVQLVSGGSQRMDSVENGLVALGTECAIVLSHDAARPFASREVIDRVIALARNGDGAVAARPVSDTLKAERNEGGSALVDRTVPRDGMWRAQTPQGFPRPMLTQAFARARQDGFQSTDEAALVERLGQRVHLVPDSRWNIKITTPEDLALAELIARQQQ